MKKKRTKSTCQISPVYWNFPIFLLFRLSLPIFFPSFSISQLIFLIIGQLSTPLPPLCSHTTLPLICPTFTLLSLHFPLISLKFPHFSLTFLRVTPTFPHFPHKLFSTFPSLTHYNFLQVFTSPAKGLYNTGIHEYCMFVLSSQFFPVPSCT